MEGIGGSEVGGGWGSGEDGFDALHHGIGEGEDADVPCGNVGVELGVGGEDREFSGSAFATFPQPDSVEFGPAVQGGGGIRGGGTGTDFSGAIF